MRNARPAVLVVLAALLTLVGPLAPATSSAAPADPVAAAAAVFVALSAGLAVSVHEARIASSRQQQVRMMADKLVFAALQDAPGGGVDELAAALTRLAGQLPAADLASFVQKRFPGDAVSQAALLHAHAPAEVFDAFCASRLDGAADVFGLLPATLPLDALLRRAWPALH